MNVRLSSKRRYYDIGIKIEKLLYSGVFSAGGRLPSERELSERFDTSRATVREAIIMLELKGLVVVRQGAGIYFIDSPKKISPKVIEPKSDIGPFELLQARQIIEGSIAASAARQIKFNELQLLKEVIKQQEKEIDGDSKRYEELDEEFHQLIAESTQNRVLIRQAEYMWSTVRAKNPLWYELNKQYLHGKKLQRAWIEDHKQILRALKKHSESDAKQAVWQHLERCKQELMKLVGSEDSSADLDDFFFAPEVPKN